MIMDSYKIRNEARVLLNHNWGTAAGTVFLMQLIYSGAGVFRDISLFFLDPHIHHIRCCGARVSRFFHQSG